MCGGGRQWMMEALKRQTRTGPPTQGSPSASAIVAYRSPPCHPCRGGERARFHCPQGRGAMRFLVREILSRSTCGSRPALCRLVCRFRSMSVVHGAGFGMPGCGAIGASRCRRGYLHLYQWTSRSGLSSCFWHLWDEPAGQSRPIPWYLSAMHHSHGLSSSPSDQRHSR